MTTTRYFVARFAQAFGIFRRNQRMGDAASEMHLLREAEAYLGRMIWEKVESIEKLSVEYWNLRKLIKERDEVIVRLGECEDRLNSAHEARANLLNSGAVTPEIFDERSTILARLEDLSRKRDQIVLKARDVRRVYDGLKMKLDVLTKEQGSTAEHAKEIEIVKSRLTSLKQDFVNLKDERLKIGEQIKTDDNELDQIDLALEAWKKERREQAAASFQVIGEANKEISTLRAELGVLDTRTSQLHGEIGRYVSRHAFNDAVSAEAAKSYRGLVDVMRALRRSIALNHRLAGLS